MSDRFCFRKDDDGHCYLIPANLADRFAKDMELAYRTEDFSGVDWVDQYRVDSYYHFSFTDPKPV